MSVPQPSAAAASAAQKPPTAFEFTKRKRWADLLINELADAIVLVLSSSCNVLYCGAAVTEILGWRDADLIDNDFLDLVTYNDQVSFRHSFNESLRTNQDLLSYTHLKCKTIASPHAANAPQEKLFEIKGYPHFVEDEQTCRCFFAVAKPYPSRNTAMLNTFLELKMENERLQQRLAYLRATIPANLDVPSTSSASVYPSASTIPSRSMNQPSTVASNHMTAYDQNNAYYMSSSLGQIGSYSGAGYVANPVQVVEDDPEDLLRKKRLKKSHSAEQYVCITCGRTDSPEWRKGPLGPKTLCNACGLRWAKQARRVDEANDATGSGSTEASA